MIFALSHNGKSHVEMIFDGEKTQTRRGHGNYEVGQTYAIQRGRGKPADPRGRLLVKSTGIEFRHAMNGLGLSTHDSPRISVEDALAEGGYTPEEYEKLWEKMYGSNWIVRYVIRFEVVKW